MVHVYMKKFFFTINAMILFERGHFLLGGPVRSHSSHIPKTTTVWFGVASRLGSSTDYSSYQSCDRPKLMNLNFWLN